MRRMTTAVLIAMLFVPTNAHAAPKRVYADDSIFTPLATVVALGGSVEWINRGDMDHTTTKASPFPYAWNKMLAPGEMWTRRFGFAGGFAYFCTLHGEPGTGMHGQVRVPLVASPAEGTRSTMITLRVATVTPPAPWVFDVEMRRGSNEFARIRTGLSSATTQWDPPRAGAFDFRARLRNASTGRATGWSPVDSVTIFDRWGQL